jgi:hypothetical protein
MIINNYNIHQSTNLTKAEFIIEIDKFKSLIKNSKNNIYPYSKLQASGALVSGGSVNLEIKRLDTFNSIAYLKKAITDKDFTLLNNLTSFMIFSLDINDCLYKWINYNSIDNIYKHIYYYMAGVYTTSSDIIKNKYKEKLYEPVYKEVIKIYNTHFSKFNKNIIINDEDDLIKNKDYVLDYSHQYRKVLIRECGLSPELIYYPLSLKVSSILLPNLNRQWNIIPGTSRCSYDIFYLTSYDWYTIINHSPIIRTKSIDSDNDWSRFRNDFSKDLSIAEKLKILL